MSEYCGRCGKDIPAGADSYRVWAKVGESRGGDVGVGSFGYFISAGSQEHEGWTIWCKSCMCGYQAEKNFQGFLFCLFLLIVAGLILYFCLS